VWEYLSKNNASRKSLLINIGGGMITDLGGFGASTFKRGIRYINIPTTLLSVVDAATGGKTGINFCGLKNEIGVINPAEFVLINVDFFKTLDENNLLSGFSEMIKHALISSEENWKNIISFELDSFNLVALEPLLKDSLQVKENIVAKDPKEENLRKALNFGHTFGHAFESLSYEQGKPALHGFAVAWGMLCELYLSHTRLAFPKEILLVYRQILKDFYGFYTINCKDYKRIFELMTHDKKNESSQINFTLLSNIGEIKINQTATKDEIFEILDFYREVAP
jgi:3-dehydroquinate synthase